MNRSVLCSAVFLLSVFLYSCGNNSSNKNYEASLAAPAETEASTAFAENIKNAISSSAALAGEDSVRQFIRTAYVNFTTKDALKTTFGIEALARRNGGYVETSAIDNRIQNERTIQISNDSSMKITSQVLASELTIRVPTIMLDSTLKEITQYIELLHSRNIETENVTLKYLSEDIQQRRAQISEQKFDSLQSRKSGNVSDFTASEEARYKRQLDADAAKIALMQLEDKIKLSTIKLSFQENEKTIKSIIPYSKLINEYKPGFGFRLVNAFRTGWEILLSLIIGIVQLWWFFAIGILVLILIINYSRKSKKNK